MNRKTFIKKSVAGIAAAPFIAKGVRERTCTIEVPTDSEVMVFTGLIKAEIGDTITFLGGETYRVTHASENGAIGILNPAA